jgi:hypothetical protein
MANNGLKAAQSVFKALVSSKGFDRVLDKVEQDLVVEMLGLNLLCVKCNFSEAFKLKQFICSLHRYVSTPKELSSGMLY